MATINKLTGTQVKQAKFEGRTFKLHDGAGLGLRVRKSGKYWMLRYRLGGMVRETTLGTFPNMSLAAARRRRDDYRALLADGIDPIERVREKRLESLREDERSARRLSWVFEQWVAKHQWSDGYREKLTGRWRRYVLPQLGNHLIDEITGAEIYNALAKAEEAGTSEIAPRCRQDLTRMYAFAIARGWVADNPAAGLKDALKDPAPTKHRAAILDPGRLGEALRAIDSHAGQPQVKAALQLLPIVMVRPGEVRLMEWSEIDFQTATWSIPASKMKMRQDHIVPLPHQVIAVLENLHHWTGHRRLVFPGIRDAARPISENTMNAAFRRMGFSKEEVTAHGFRATARTLIAERLRWPSEVIEVALAHSKKGSLGSAYDRAIYLEDRRKMLQEWADFLDSLRAKPASARSE